MPHAVFGKFNRNFRSKFYGKAGKEKVVLIVDILRGDVSFSVLCGKSLYFMYALLQETVKMVSAPALVYGKIILSV